MNDFDQLIHDIETEAQQEGPAAVAELREFDERFSFASQLLAARKSVGMTQKALAELSGVQQAEISRIERGAVVPKLTTVSRLLRPLGRKLTIVEDDERLAA